MKREFATPTTSRKELARPYDIGERPSTALLEKRPRRVSLWYPELFQEVGGFEEDEF